MHTHKNCNQVDMGSPVTVIFLTTKVLVLAKIGGVFSKNKSVKRDIFSVRGTSIVTIKQRESDARGYNLLGFQAFCAQKLRSA